MKRLFFSGAFVAALALGGCMYPGEYTDAQGHELRNNCLIQSMCLDLPANRPGAVAIAPVYMPPPVYVSPAPQHVSCFQSGNMTNCNSY